MNTDFVKARENAMCKFMRYSDNCNNNNPISKIKWRQKIETLISQNSTEADLQKAAVEQGMLTMRQDGVFKILQGITSFDEVERIAGF